MITFASYRTFRGLLLATGTQGEQPISLSTNYGASSVVRQTVHEVSFCSLSSPPLPPPVAWQPTVGYGFRIFDFSRSHSETRHSVGLLWTEDEPDAETSTWKHTTFTRDWHPRPGGIQSRNPSKRKAEDPCFTPRGHWDCCNIPLVQDNANEVRELIRRIDLFMNDSVTWKSVA